MKNKLFGIIAVTAIIITAGCASLFYNVRITTPNNVSSVIRGGTLALRSSGRDLSWTVSSTSAGGGPVANGTFISPNGMLTVSSSETASVLYVSVVSNTDGNSDIKAIRIVTVSAVAITPSNQPAVLGRTLQLNAQVSGTNNPEQNVTWRIMSNVSPGTTINSNGVLTVSGSEAARLLNITATSIIDPSKSASINITVVVPTVTSITVGPQNQMIEAGTTLQFTSQVRGTNDPDTRVTWKVSGNAAGTSSLSSGTRIDSNGLLSVSANETSVIFVIATSVQDTSKTASVMVGVTPSRSSSLIGTWVWVSSVGREWTYTFNSDGSFTMNSLRYTYTVSGNTLTMYGVSGLDTYTYSINGNILTLTARDTGEVMTLTRR